MFRCYYNREATGNHTLRTRIIINLQRWEAIRKNLHNREAVHSHMRPTCPSVNIPLTVRLADLPNSGITSPSQYVSLIFL